MAEVEKYAAINRREEIKRLELVEDERFQKSCRGKTSKTTKFWFKFIFLPLLVLIAFRESMLNKGWYSHYWWKRSLHIPDL